jgi:hypothetical protein
MPEHSLRPDSRLHRGAARSVRSAVTCICNCNRIITGLRVLFRVTVRRHDLAAEV